MRRVALLARVVYGAKNGFAHIASALEAAGLLGGEARIIFTEDPASDARRLEVKGYRPVVLYGVSTPVFLELEEEIRSIASRYPVVAGGPHAEGAYWHLLRDGALAAVIGDGEAAITGLVEYMLGWRDISSVPNIAYIDSGRFRTSRVVLVDLDEYKPYSEVLNLYPPIEIMRGCMYRCRFCQVPWQFKSSVRYRSPGPVRDAVRVYVRHGRRDIRFIAPVGFAYMSVDGKPNPSAIEELLKGVRSEGGKPYLGTFPSETRPEYIDPEVLNIVKRYAANKRISIGLQSGSEDLLKRVGRGHGVAEALEAVELVLKHGFGVVVDLIFGMPGEAEEDVEETIEVMYKLAGMGAKMRLHTFLPLPGTPYARTRPQGIHPKYRRAVLRLLGRGVFEGDWREQEELAWRMYCRMARDPYPSTEPRPLPGYTRYCTTRNTS
ncbi:MAG: TIGR04013 family B12-binding domain/radical SAM domain-containing protein [Desulfurococcales archaeon]|nr:TIGR04013 family B12-binding domain/radical SAM domain-containing protein [Desulfurococcales archaeon]